MPTSLTIRSRALAAALIGFAAAFAPTLPAAPANAQVAAPQAAAPAQPKGFTGRYRRGPERALARIVMFTDYQCPDCRRAEQEAMHLVEQHPGQVSLSTKHFPFSNLCNPIVTDNPHPNACWAARAAEAAGIMGGPDDYFRMHDWLFERGGTFDHVVLSNGLTELGFEPQQFIAVMESPETLELVRRDIDEATALGLWSTPMIFINGIELKERPMPGVLTGAVRAVLARGGEPATAEADSPPPAREKLITDWRSTPAIPLPAKPNPHALGPENAPVRVVLFGDYQEATCAEADATLRRIVRERSDVRYEFRHFPAHTDCNPACPRDLHAQACGAARAVEAVAAIKGEDAFWAMHERLLALNESLTDDAIRQTAASLGVDAAALESAMQADDIDRAIAHDGRLAVQRGLTAIPYIFVNDRPLRHWKLGDTNYIPLFVETAAESAKK